MTESPRCSGCGGPYHEASGHRWTDEVVLCGVCAISWKDWLRRHLQRRWGGVKFYDHAWMSIVPGRDYTKKGGS